MVMAPEQHEAHMQKVNEGLNAILQSQDINEIHQIAQSLLTEEQGEQQEQGPEAEGGLRGMMRSAIAKGQEGK